MTARVSMLLKSHASLTCFRAFPLPDRAKDLSARRKSHSTLQENISKPSTGIIPSIIEDSVLKSGTTKQRTRDHHSGIVSIYFKEGEKIQQ